MAVRWALIATFALAGCGSHDHEKASHNPAAPAAPTGTPGSEESRVFDVKSPADLLALRSEYQKLWESGFEGTLEVNLAAADYLAQSWELGPAPDSRRKTAAATIDVVLRGGPATVPPPSLVRARTLRLENLVLRGAGAPWQLQIGESFAMKNSMMVDARARKWDSGPFLAVLGRGDEGARRPRPVTARIESSWFVRNWQDESPATMVGFGSVDTAPSYWESIAIDDCVFLGNAFAVSLGFEFAKSVRIARTLFFKPWPAGVVIQSTSSDRIVVDDSVVVVDSIERIAAHGAESPPIELGKGSRIYVKGWTPGAPPPPTLVADPGQIRDRGALGAGEAILNDAAVGLPADTLPLPDRRDQLFAAARP
jgi:hypothetical protein